MEKTLQYSSKPTRKPFYFQPKVSVQRAVLHQEAPYQHCDSSMQYNLQDQRFQKILRSAYRQHLKSSLPFRQWKLKFSEYILKLWTHMTSSGSPSHSWQAPVSFRSLYVMPAKTPLRMSMNWSREQIYLEGWVSFVWINCAVLFVPCWQITGVAQGRKTRQEKVASAYINLGTPVTYRTKA